MSRGDKEQRKGRDSSDTFVESCMQGSGVKLPRVEYDPTRRRGYLRWRRPEPGGRIWSCCCKTHCAMPQWIALYVSWSHLCSVSSLSIYCLQHVCDFKDWPQRMLLAWMFQIISPLLHATDRPVRGRIESCESAGGWWEASRGSLTLLLDSRKTAVLGMTC